MLHDGIEIKNTDMGFYIKEFEARGNGKKPARVSFINGCNVIYGGSDNGKTTLFKLIDFIFEKKIIDSASSNVMLFSKMLRNSMMS